MIIIRETLVFIHKHFSYARQENTLLKMNDTDRTNKYIMSYNTPIPS